MRHIFTATLLTLCLGVQAQTSTDKLTSTTVNKPVEQYDLRVDLTSPLASFLSMEYIAVSGQQRLWADISTYQYRYIMSADASDQEVSEQAKQNTLQTLIEEMIVYRDSVAAVISKSPANDYHLIYWCRLEDGRWVNAGQDLGMTLQQARDRIALRAEAVYATLAVIERLKAVPTGEALLVDWLRAHGSAPKDFMFSSLESHKLVVYGELHRRVASWDLIRSLVGDKRFARRVGTVFMELPSHAQDRMDRFMDGKTMQSEILLSIFRDEQPQGWYDKGEFLFLTELWKLNNSLPVRQRIKVVLVDFQISYSDIRSAEEFRNYPDQDRNTHMAGVIERTLDSSSDKRSSLFIVGFGHAYKSAEPGHSSTPWGMEPAPTVAAQLARSRDVFTIMQHVAPISNNGRTAGLIRDGAFDRAFALAGNRPVAFPLAGSPFGLEPFDAAPEMTYSPLTGSFVDNYDGYIFLMPLADEGGQGILYEVFSDDFVTEMKRRATYLGMRPGDTWYGVVPSELTAEGIKQRLMDNSEKPSRWGSVVK